MDCWLESNQLGIGADRVEADEREYWIAHDPRTAGDLDPEIFGCKYQGTLIFKAGDGTAYCKTCWSHLYC